MDATLKAAAAALRSGVGCELYHRLERLPVKFIGPPRQLLRVKAQVGRFSISCLAEPAAVTACANRLEKGLPANKLYTSGNRAGPRPCGLTVDSIKAHVANGDAELLADLHANKHPNVFRLPARDGVARFAIGKKLDAPWTTLADVVQYSRGKWHRQIMHWPTGLCACDDFGKLAARKITPEKLEEDARGHEVINDN